MAFVDSSIDHSHHWSPAGVLQLSHRQSQSNPRRLRKSKVRDNTHLILRWATRSYRSRLPDGSFIGDWHYRLRTPARYSPRTRSRPHGILMRDRVVVRPLRGGGKKDSRWRKPHSIWCESQSPGRWVTRIDISRTETDGI